MKYLKLYEEFRIIMESKSIKHEIINYPNIDSNNNPPLLLIPGGGGDPEIDFSKLAPLLSKNFNLLTFYYDETKDGDVKEVAKEIDKQLKEKLGKDLSKLNILGFSMGTSWGFWIIKQLGDNFKGKFICVDAAAPQASTPEQYVSNTLIHNTPRRYQCISFPFFEYEFEKGEEPTKEQSFSYNYSYKKDIEDKLEEDKKTGVTDIDLTKCKPSDFVFNLQSEYESWRRTKFLVIEFLDDEGKIGKGNHYPSELNPSNIWVNGKQFDIPDNIVVDNIKDYVKEIIKLTNVNNENDVWIIQDKHDKGTHDVSGKFYLDPSCDRKGHIDFLTKQSKGMVGSMMRDPKNPEKINTECLIIRAGKQSGKDLTKEKAQEDIETFPSENTKVEVLKDVEHFNILQSGCEDISDFAQKFFL